MLVEPTNFKSNSRALGAMSDGDRSIHSGDDTFVEGTASTNKTVDGVSSAEDAITRLETSSDAEKADEPEELDTSVSLAFKSDNHNKITHNRAVCYHLLNILFGLSRYLESYYRFDDELAIREDPGRTIQISTYYS